MNSFTHEERTEHVRSLIVSGQARQRRIDAGLSREAMAQALDITSSTVFRWEIGRSHPRGKNLVAYHRLLCRLVTGDSE